MSYAALPPGHRVYPLRPKLVRGAFFPARFCLISLTGGGNAGVDVMAGEWAELGEVSMNRHSHVTRNGLGVEGS